MLPLPKSYNFDSVSFIQEINNCKSRLDVDITSEIIKGVFRPIPMIAANMSSVINSEFCIKLYKLGAFGILHRAASEEHMISEVQAVAKECEWVASSVGIGVDQYNLAKKLIDAGANIICIDIAHGYCEAVQEMLHLIKGYSPDTKVIVGNINNPKAYEMMQRADAIKIGIANGLACETKDTAGCVEGQFSIIRNWSEYYGRNYPNVQKIPIISDGGIRKPSDFTKAILAGASSVMAGSIFARCPESAGKMELTGHGLQKIYLGMASREVQEEWKGGLKKGTCPEGKKVYLELGESAEALLERYSGALRSGISYTSGKNITQGQRLVTFIEIVK